MEGDVITMSEIYTFARQGKDEDGNIKGEFKATGVVPNFNNDLKGKGIVLPISIFGLGPDAINF